VERTQGSEPDITSTQQVINATAVTVGGIYLTTHSVSVTIVGAAASTLLNVWALWLAHRRNQAVLTGAQVKEPEALDESP
jgi:hypothetical protein